MAMTVDGLVTGMSTTDTVNQLMQVEALPQTALKTKITVQNRTVTAYQSVNSKMLALVDAAEALSNPKTWTSMKATSSSDAAVVTALPGASAGSFSFKVTSLAAAHTATFTGASVSSPSGTFLESNTLTFKTAISVTNPQGTKTLTLTDTSLKGVAAAINGDPDALFKAATVQVGPGQYTLQLTAKTTGAAAAFSNDLDADLTNNLSDALTGIKLSFGGPTLTTQGADAKLKVGTAAGAYDITSTTNTFAEVQPGVTVTATKMQADADAPVTISLASDAEGIATKMQALIDGANAALGEIAAQTKGKNGTVAAGALVGDSAMRKLSQDIMSTVSGGAGALGTFNAVGVGLDRTGKLTLDKEAFAKAYAADPVKTQAYFDSYTQVAHANASPTKFDPGWDQSQGLANKLLTVGLQASEGVKLPTDLPGTLKEGVLQGLIKRRTDSIKSLNVQISSWDVRLDMRQSALQRQFSNLEVAMGKMQQQSSWLASQLAGLS